MKIKTAEELGITKNGVAALLTARRVLKKLVAGKRVTTVETVYSYHTSYLHKRLPFTFNMDFERKLIMNKKGSTCGTAGCILGIIDRLHPVPLDEHDRNALRPLFYPKLRLAGGDSTKAYNKIKDTDALKAVEHFLKTGVIRFKSYLPEGE